MRQGLNPRTSGLLAVGSLAGALWISLWLQTARFSFLEHRWIFRPAGFSLIWALCFLGLAALWLGIRKFEALRTPDGNAIGGTGAALDFFPLGFLFLAPLLLSHYLTREDLRARLILLALFVLAAVAALAVSRWKRASLNFRGLERLEARFEALSRRKKLGVLFLAAYLVYGGVASLLVSEKITFSGDEPHYLMTSHSLLMDRDIDVANNYSAQDYFHFFDKRSDPHLRLNPHGQRGKNDPHAIYPINMPGISILILPFYGLSFLAKGKLLAWILKGSLSFWAALLGAQFYLLALQFWKRSRLALGLWALYMFTAPVLFFAVHLYPEIPIACFSVFVFRLTYCSDRTTTARSALCGVLLALFPWFGLKYLLILGPLLVVAAFSQWKRQRAGWKTLPLVLLPVLGVALYFLFIHHLYGTWSPAAVYKGAMTAESAAELAQNYTDIPFSMRLDTLAGYFLDQRDGLLPYAPYFFFSGLGLVGLFRARKRDLGVLLFIVLPYVVGMAFLTERGGFSPPARPLTVVSWILMLGVGAFAAENRRPFWSFLWKASAAAGLAMAVLLVRHPFFLYQPTTHDTPVRAGDMFVHLGHLGFFPPPLLPSFIKYPNRDHTANIAWMAVLALAVLAYFFIRPKKSPVPRPIVRTALVVLVMGAAFWLWILFPRPALFNQRTVRYAPGKALAFYLFPAGRGIIYQPPGKLYLHFEKSYRLLFQADSDLDRLHLEFGSAKGEYGVRVRFFDRTVFDGRIDRGTRSVDLPNPAFYPNGRFRLYEVDVSLRHFSEENMLDEPFLLRIVPPDE